MLCEPVRLSLWSAHHVLKRGVVVVTEDRRLPRHDLYRHTVPFFFNRVLLHACIIHMTKCSHCLRRHVIISASRMFILLLASFQTDQSFRPERRRSSHPCLNARLPHPLANAGSKSSLTRYRRPPHQ